MRRLMPVLMMLAAPALAASDSHVWADYANVKYQFQTCYPSDLLKAQGESPASDGQSFTASGVELAASGIYNIDNETAAQLADETGKRLTGAAGSVTYRRVLPGSFTLSGQSGDVIFYTKAFVGHGTLKHFELTSEGAGECLQPGGCAFAALFSGFGEVEKGCGTVGLALFS